MTAIPQRVALVTGAGEGIGLAISKVLAKRGDHVLVADRSEGSAKEAVRQIEANGGSASAMIVDVSKVAPLKLIFASIANNFDRLDILVSHAGAPGPIGFDFTEDEFDSQIDVNLKSHFFGTKFALELMLKQSFGGTIVYTSSTAALRGYPRAPLYGASKAAILALMRSVARKYGSQGIRANAVCPGPTETAFSRSFAKSAGIEGVAYDELKRRSAAEIPLGRTASPEDVAEAVSYLTGDAGAYLSGVVLPVDGAYAA